MRADALCPVWVEFAELACPIESKYPIILSSGRTAPPLGGGLRAQGISYNEIFTTWLTKKRNAKVSAQLDDDRRVLPSSGRVLLASCAR